MVVLHSRGGSAKCCISNSIIRGITGTQGALNVDVWRTYIDVLHFAPIPIGSNSLTPHFDRRIDYSGRENAMRWFYEDMEGCRRLFLERMSAGLPPLQRAADVYRAEQVAWAAEKSSFEHGQRIEVPADWEG